MSGNQYQQRKAFYQQFNQADQLHQAWCESPEGMVEILREPWKAQPPVIYVDVPGEKSAAAILQRLRDRHQ